MAIPMKYYFEYFAYTDNLNYGRQLITQGRNKAEVELVAQLSGKGCYRIEKHKVPNTK